jgi:hypothetical protein
MERFRLGPFESALVIVRVGEEIRFDALARRLVGFDWTTLPVEAGVTPVETPDRRMTRREVSRELRAARCAVLREVEMVPDWTRLVRMRAVRSWAVFAVRVGFRTLDAADPRARN